MASSRYLPRTMGAQGRVRARDTVRREDGQILPLLLLILLVTLSLGVLVFQTGRAAVLRSDAQSAADASALAGVRNVKQQLEAQVAATGVANPLAVNDVLVRAAATDYARRNGGEVVSFERLGVDVRVRVRTKDDLGEQAEPLDQEDLRGTARARATLGLAPGIAGGGAAVIPGIGGGGGSVSGDTKVAKDEWEQLAEDVGKPPFNSDDIVKVGRFLQRHGMQVAEHPAFGGVGGGHGHYGVNDHYHGGAIDVNLAGGDAAEAVVFDRVEPELAKIGFQVLWRVPNHAPGDNSHMHVDIGPGGQGGGAVSGGGGGLGFPLFGDAMGEIRLVPWEGGPSLLAGLGGGGNPFGPPDLDIACDIFSYAERRDLGPKMLLAAMEAAIVESGMHNLNWGDADSLGVFQQRPSVGEWGTAAEILDVDHAIMAFFRAARRYDRPGQTAGQLAQATQRSAFPERYDQVRGQAMDIIAKMERGCDGGKFS